MGAHSLADIFFLIISSETTEGFIKVPEHVLCEFVIFDSAVHGNCFDGGQGSYEIYFNEIEESNLIVQGG